MLDVRDKLTKINGVGDVSAKKFNKLSINTVGDLINHFPYRYDTYAYPVAIKDAAANELVTIEAYVKSSPKLFKKGRFKIVQVLVRDDTDAMMLKWFNSDYIVHTLKFDGRYIFRGKISVVGGQKTMTQPEIYTREKYRELLRGLRPVYSSTAGLGKNYITKTMGKVFDELVLKEYLPDLMVKQFDFPRIRDAYNCIHFPKDKDELAKAMNRLIFDEFFCFLGTMRGVKSSERLVNINHLKRTDKIDEIIKALGYELTADQRKSIDEIFADVDGDYVMQRLLQGDVGSGKTVVALIILAAAALNGYQGCIMAPTEVLAKQHYEYFVKLLEPFGIRIAFLAGSITASQKKKEYEKIANGEVDIVVGTHAAIWQDVKYKNLAMVVIDEQHRFGVKQREALALKGEGVHLLLMSATPIPRTYALMLYQGMDISTLKTMPNGRKPIKNCVANETMRATVDRFMLREIDAGHQIYIICPLIEESEESDGKSVIEYTEELKQKFKSLRIEALTGRLKPAEKNDIMSRFEKHELDVLVSTTVIEVGVNVPNATLMLIENAERFGLAQLHQIRGRVGRGDSQSYCIFMSESNTENAKERLDIVSNSNDGFYIASQDMKLRGPGEFFGTKQSGDEQFTLADPSRDMLVLEKAKMAVDSLSDEELKAVLSKRIGIVSSMDFMVY